MAVRMLSNPISVSRMLILEILKRAGARPLELRGFSLRLTVRQSTNLELVVRFCAGAARLAGLEAGLRPGLTASGCRLAARCKLFRLPISAKEA
jgi:hypothetical protein